MPGGRPSRRLVAIKDSGTIKFRWVSGGYKAPAQINRHNTKWASCEMKASAETNAVFTITAITASGHPIYTTDAVSTPRIVIFNSPCPLGTPPHRHKKKTEPPKPVTPAKTQRRGLPNQIPI